MIRRVLITLALTSAVLADPAAPPNALAGGATTVFLASADAFAQPAANLAPEGRAAFFVGNSFFKQNWVAAPASTSARDGLGPLFNARSCSACHVKDGRGSPPAAPGEDLVALILRLSRPGVGPHGEPLSDPVYGAQLQTRALPGVPPEATVRVDYEAVPGRYIDGEAYELRRPVYRIENPCYGPFAPELLVSPRISPVLIGLGLLEAIPEETLLALADPDDRDGDGISGRVQRVRDAATERTAVGRFGWKAEQPTVLAQVAAAFREDLGLTTSVQPAPNHTAAQPACATPPDGGSPEVSDRILHDVVLYTRTLAVPAARDAAAPAVLRGRELFNRLQCAVCHRPEFTTGDLPGLPELSRQTIRPHTDLLLHDMGDDLADHRPSFGAGGREWRTPPLWGIGLVPVVNGHTTLLHDGRARDIAEAILWHGGEAAAAREAFRALPRAERDDLITFIRSL